MKIGSIGARMLLAALLPVALVAMVFSILFLVIRSGDLAEFHNQRSRALARQLAAASEYGLFSGNISHLQFLATGALRVADVRSVEILDANGARLVQAGQPRLQVDLALTGIEGQRLDRETQIELMWQPIAENQVKVDDLFAVWSADRVVAQQSMGYVLIEFTGETLARREREMWLAGLVITLAGLMFGGFLAVGLGQGVIRPVERVSRMIERIGRGEFSARAELLPNDPLRELQWGLNQMADRLQSGRDELEQRIDMATAELREKKEEAETATLAKSRFLAAASHDLRQPTHALGMFVARLAQLSHDEESRILIGHLDASVRATQDLLDALLDISRLDANAVPVHARPFALADLFAQLQESLALTAEVGGLRLRIRPTGVWLFSDPTLVYRILLNLAVNAVRYTIRGSVLIACRVTADGQYARIEVWDSGIGIAPEHHQQIFREFYQVGNAERDRGKGLGLGLNIVERTASLLGHRLQLRSILGRGTRFSLEVPLAPSGAWMLASETPEVASIDALSGLAVLVVEDDALALEALTCLLESWGALVVAAEGLSDAMRQIQSGWVPDVILSDYRLRDGENGINVIRQVRATVGRQIPAGLMSGDTDAGLMAAARQAGLVLLHKPVRPAKLRSLIARLVVADQSDGSEML